MADDRQTIRVEIDGDANDLEAALLEASAALRAFGREADKQNAASVQTERQNARTSQSFRQLDRDTDNAANTLAKFKLGLGAIAWGSAVAGIAPLSAAVFDLGAAATGAVAAVAPLGGLVATLPSVLGAGAQAVGTIQLAFENVVPALEGNVKAYQKLDPLQRQFVDRVNNDIKPALGGLQDAAEKGLIPPVTAALSNLVKDAPVVQKVIGETASALGGLVEKASQMASTPGFQKDLGSFGKTNAGLITNVGDGLLHAADGMRQVAVAAEPLTTDMGRLADNLGRQFDVWATHARQSGELTRFFDLTDQRVHQLVGGLEGFGQTLGNVLMAAQPLAGPMMAGFVSGMDHLATLTASPQGQQALQHFFAGAYDPLHQATLLARDLLIDLGKLAEVGEKPLASLLADARKDLLPALDDVATILAKDVVPPLIGALDDVAKLGKDLAPGLKPVGVFLGDAATALGAVASATDAITKDLPGVLKLAPTLALIFGGKAAISKGPGLLKDLWHGKGGAAGAAAAGLLETPGATPAHPMYVVVMGEYASSSGLSNIKPLGSAEHEAEQKAASAAEGAAGGAAASKVGEGFLDTLRQDGLKGVLATGARAAATDVVPVIVTGGAITLGIAGITKGVTSLFGQGVAPTPAEGHQDDAQSMRDLAAAVEPAQVKLNQVDAVLARLKADLAAHPDSGGYLQAQIDDEEKARQSILTYAQTHHEKLVEVQGDSQTAMGAVGRAFSDAAQSVQTAMALASGETDRGAGQIKTSAGKAGGALASAFSNAASSLDSAVQTGLQNVVDNTNTVSKQLGGAGVKVTLRSAVAGGIGAGLGIVGSAVGSATSVPGAAQGAFVGRQGERGHDNVPALLNGQPAVIARGEYVGVFNHQQQDTLNGILAAHGYRGLPDFFNRNDRPHYMAKGGGVPGDGLAAMVAEANQISRAHYPYVWGGGHNASFAGPYDCSGAVSAVLHAAGLLDHPLVSGQFENWGLPGPGVVSLYASPQHVYMSLAGRFFGTHGADGAGWFQGSARPGFVVRHAPVGGNLIKAPGVAGTGSFPGIARAAIDKAASAANHHVLAELAAQTATGAGNWGDLAGPWVDVMHRIATDRGWSFTDWMNVVQRESGGNPNALNPSSGAYGLGQMLGSNLGTYYKIGDPANVQIAGMARYISDRYGNPTAAWAHEQQFGWYDRGGLIRAAGGTGVAAKKKRQPGKHPGRKPQLNMAQLKQRLLAKVQHPFPSAPLTQLVTTLMGSSSGDAGSGLRSLLDVTGVKGAIQQRLDDQNRLQQLYAVKTFNGQWESRFVTDAAGNETGLNWNSYRDPSGHLIYGINAHLAEDDAELADLGLRSDGSVLSTGVLGLYDAMGPVAANVADRIASALAERQQRVQLVTQLARLELRRKNAIQKLISTMQRRQITTAAGQAAALQDATSAAQQERSTLSDEIANLQAQKSASTDPKTILSIDAAIRDKQTQQRHVSDRVNQLRAHKSSSAAYQLHMLSLRDDLNAINADLQTWTGTTGPDAANKSAWSGQSFGKRLMTEINQDLIPARDWVATLRGPDGILASQRFAVWVNAMQLLNDRSDWAGTQMPVSASTLQDQTALNQLLQQQLAHSQFTNDLLTQQFSAFAGFAPLLEGRLVGSFARGGVIPETGLALVHRGETVIPDPQGPYGHQGMGSAGVVEHHHHHHVELRLDDGGLLKVVDQRIADKAPVTVSRKLGTRSRLIRAAPGGGGLR